MKLTLCRACDQHVRVEERACPFCGAEIAPSRSGGRAIAYGGAAIAAATGIALTAASLGCAYGPAPLPDRDSGSRDDSGSVEDSGSSVEDSGSADDSGPGESDSGGA